MSQRVLEIRLNRQMQALRAMTRRTQFLTYFVVGFVFVGMVVVMQS